MKKIVIYPGRFQPMLPHHAEVYNKLKAQFPGAEVYVATSNKVEGSKSPFNFEEKKQIITQMHGIPEENIILAANPYLIDSYMKEFDQKNTMVIFAVGGKDEDRFPMKNIDDSTGLNMSLRGETRPTYYQMINTLEQHPALPMSDRGYIYLAPTVAGRGEVASASAFRKAFTSVEDTEKRKEIFQKYMGEFNETIFSLLNDKLIGEKMSEQLEVMKYLAGLLNEAPPVNFDADVDTGMTNDEDDEYATKPGYEQDSMITQLGKIIDSDDVAKDADAMKIKKFTPVTQVNTDDGQAVDVTPAEAKALKQMMEMLSSARMGEEQSPREKFLDAIQTSKGLKNMIDFAYDKQIVQKNETFVTSDMNLDDIRESYGIDERDMCHSKTHDCATLVIHPTWGEGKPVYESHAVPTEDGYVAWYDVEFEHGIEKEVPAEDMEIITLAEHGVKASKKNEKFKPHMMYDPKTGKGEMAKKEEDHIRLAKKGYVHDKPKMDERAECHSKTHDCATLVIHPEWGEGKPVYESHAVPTDDGYVAWYDVEFEHGIEKEVPAEDMEIIKLAEHGAKEGMKKKKKKKVSKKVDERALCHSKKHDCATVVFHEEYGIGKPLYEKHAIPTDDGYVAWYDVEFKHGIEEQMSADDMEIIDMAEHGTTASKEYDNDTKLMAGRLKDVIIDAMQMDKEEFDAEYKGMFDYDELNKTYNEEHPEYVPSEEPSQEDMERGYKEESAPFGEPSEDDQMYEEMMDVYEKGGEPALAKHLGMSDKELDEEIDEWCRDNNKHPDDDRDEAIQGVCEDMIHNRDRKDYGSAMYDEALEELKKLAGLV